MSLWHALDALPSGHLFILIVALAVAFGFEFINGFHDTANAVATVIYTRTMRPTKAVLYSGVMNFFGVLLGGTGVAFGIVSLLPVDMLVHADTRAALVMVLALLFAGVVWNLGTWYLGLPVSSSHTLIGSILGVGLANSLLGGHGLTGLNWPKVGEVALALLISPLIGFVGSYFLLLLMKRLVPVPKLYQPPEGEDRPPGWIRATLVTTCGAVSFAHGSNDGQKGMGLILLVLIGFIPAYYALNTDQPETARDAYAVAGVLQKGFTEQTDPQLRQDVELILNSLNHGEPSYDRVPRQQRWEVRSAIFRTARHQAVTPEQQNQLRPAYEFVPLWVVVGTALSLGIGTTIGYRRIVITVAERIGKSHLTYAQGATAEFVAASTILLADVLHAPVSTTQVLSSGVAGTMVANRSGLQRTTVRKIFLAWVMTLPATMLLSAMLYVFGRWLVT
jgi:phosphate/sulfate permease